MGIIDKVKTLVGLPVRQGDAMRPNLRADYMQGNRGVIWQGWSPTIRDARDDVVRSWDKAAARAVDLVHNSGWIAGALDQAVTNVVGTGLRLKAMPENGIFGMSNADARAWSKIVEQRFDLWASNALECDAEGRRTLGMMQAAAFRSWFAYGEIFAELPWRMRMTSGTKVRLIEPHRIPRANDDLRNIVQGVRMDADGLPVGYLCRKRDKFSGDVDFEVRARDALWRPRVVHVFDGMIGAVRGITPMVPALRVARQFEQLGEATLMAAIIQSVFAASIESNEPTEEVLQGLLTPQEQTAMAVSGKSVWDAWFEAQSGWYDNATINVGINGRVAHLFPGQKLNFHASEHPNGNYRDFAMHLLREIARCIGLTYESATGDWEGATYSSTKLATTEIYAITLYRRKNIVAPLCQAAYEAWLEEEVQSERVPFPGGIDAFHANRAAACRAMWRGTPKPQADDLKIAKAHEVWRNMGVMTDEMIANDLGMDIEDVYAQRAQEADMRTEYGLEDMYPTTPKTAPDEDGNDPLKEGATNG